MKNFALVSKLGLRKSSSRFFRLVEENARLIRLRVKFILHNRGTCKRYVDLIDYFSGVIFGRIFLWPKKILQNFRKC